jgi:hypothetical protein
MAAKSVDVPEQRRWLDGPEKRRNTAKNFLPPCTLFWPNHFI